MSMIRNERTKRGGSAQNMYQLASSLNPLIRLSLPDRRKKIGTKRDKCNFEGITYRDCDCESLSSCHNNKNKMEIHIKKIKKIKL